MLTGIAVILLAGLAMGRLFSKLKLPGLLGMMIAGMVLGPFCLDVIDGSVLQISGEIRQMALVIILTRAGLSLTTDELKSVGRPAVLMCFVPACLEMLGVILLAPALLDVSVAEAALIGSVIAAVSPAVVVPRMIRLMEEGYGQTRHIPQLVLAGASVDDVFVIVVFTALTGFLASGTADVLQVAGVPVSIALGVLLGIAVGAAMLRVFRAFAMSDPVKVLILLSISFLLLETEDRLEGILPVSGLLAIMSMGMLLRRKEEPLARRLSAIYNKLWLAAEVFLFVLVGAAVDLKYAAAAGLAAAALVAGAMVWRMGGVALSVAGTALTRKERLFCMVAYTPKATVQAAIGAIPLSMGLACGNTALTVAVLSILITAPFGAICIDKLYRRLLDGPKN